MLLKPWMSGVVAGLGVLFASMAQANFPSVPKETYKALNLEQSASPKELHEAITKRYKDPAQGAGRGTLAQYWEPIPMSMYFDPASYYKPPTSMKEVADRQECVKCHTDESPVWVTAWKKSTHANLDRVRNLKPEDPTFYKKAKLEEVEKNLRSMNRLGANEKLKEVGCIDCHVDINAKGKADHMKDLRMPTADVCGVCHLAEFAERESERDTLIWPNNQWPQGRPSHALDWKANVEVAVFASMPQREIAEGCSMCHTNQNKCDNCHTRHEFSAAESRKPEACATCHSGVDHNTYEAYTMSKHGKTVLMMGDKWNWNVPLKDAYTKGGQTAPTCAGCHFEYEGKYSHNVVRKVRWANYPAVPGVAENITSEWSEARLDSWVKTCTSCHSERFARSYLEFMDKGTLHGIAKYKEAHEVAEKLYKEGLLTGQKTNRPLPLPPDKEMFAGFTQLFWSKDNNPAAIELQVLEMGENDLPQLHVGLSHVNPGGWTYSQGWGPMNRAYVNVMDANTRIREMAALQEEMAQLRSSKRTSLLDLNTTNEKISLGGLGAGMLLAGTLALAGWRRREKSARDQG